MIDPFAGRESGVQSVAGRLIGILRERGDQVGQHQRLHGQRAGHTLGIDEQVGHVLVHARLQFDGVVAEGGPPRMGTTLWLVVPSHALRNVLMDALAIVLDVVRGVPRLKGRTVQLVKLCTDVVIIQMRIIEL